MAGACLHAVVCLIAFGRPYFDLNKQLDLYSRKLGSRHRVMGHDYYHAYGSLWDFNEPFPLWLREIIERIKEQIGDVAAEEEQVRHTHSYIDRVWDNLSKDERKVRQAALIRLALDPNWLRSKAGVDVLEGSIHRVVDGHEVWERVPDLPNEYLQLVKHIRRARRA